MNRVFNKNLKDIGGGRLCTNLFRCNICHAVGLAEEPGLYTQSITEADYFEGWVMFPPKDSLFSEERLGSLHKKHWLLLHLNHLLIVYVFVHSFRHNDSFKSPFLSVWNSSEL